MIALNDFNQLDHLDAVARLRPCVAIERWAEALVNARPFANLAALFDAAREVSLTWDEAELALALSAHPRIGEKPAGQQVHAVMSRQEQSTVNDSDAALALALREGNACYEARFGRVFLIRAKGRSGEEILQVLKQRLKNSEAEEVQSALAQLREITLLRLESVVVA